MFCMCASRIMVRICVAVGLNKMDSELMALFEVGAAAAAYELGDSSFFFLDSSLLRAMISFFLGQLIARVR